jgi:hypothetical protein
MRPPAALSGKSAGTSANTNAAPAAPKAPAAAKPQPSAAGAAVRPAAAKPPARPQPSGAGASGGRPALSSEDVQRIYSNYVAARKQNAERVDNVKLDSIEKTLRGMLPQLEKKHAGKKIDFEVVVKDGKVALKPVAK